MGFVAWGSGTATSTISKIVDYTRNMSKALHKPPGSKIDEEANTPPIERSTSLDYFPSHNPVQHAAHYSPEHLDALAYRMASKSLPNAKDRSKHKKTHSWSPVQRASSMLHTKDKTVHYHGRFHDASVETGHFAYEMGATALQGMLHLSQFPTPIPLLERLG